MEFTAFCQNLSMPREDAAYLSEIFRTLSDREDFAAYQQQVKCAAYALDEQQGNALIQKAAEQYGIHPHTMECILLLTTAMAAKEHYDAYRIPESIYYDSMADIVTWMRMCKKETGIIGTLDNFGWLLQPMVPRIVKLGRLQFEMIALTKPPKQGELYDTLWLTPDMLLAKNYTGIPALNVHIPEGTKLDHAEVLASYEQAKAFFSELFDFHPHYLFCYSWLLAPCLQKLLPAQSNILAFAADYAPLYSRPYPKAKWRIFGSKQPLEVKTSLQRSAKAWYDAGNEIDETLGMIRL